MSPTENDHPIKNKMIWLKNIIKLTIHVIIFVPLYLFDQVL